jgi:hypothetical protein
MRIYCSTSHLPLTDPSARLTYGLHQRSCNVIDAYDTFGNAAKEPAIKGGAQKRELKRKSLRKSL